jgi:hypothetical protein
MAGEVRAAIGTATVWRRLGAGQPPPVRVAGLAYLPLVGALVGLVATLAAALVGAAAPLAGAVVGVGLLEVLSGRVPTVAGGLAVLVKVEALAQLPLAVWTPALLLAPALGRWAVVVQCYGGRAAPGDREASLVGRARFREFGAASVSAIGGALVGLDALGLVAVVLSALATVAVRTLAYRRAAGLDRRWLERTETLVETIVLIVLAVFAMAVRPAA